MLKVAGFDMHWEIELGFLMHTSLLSVDLESRGLFWSQQNHSLSTNRLLQVQELLLVLGFPFITHLFSANPPDKSFNPMDHIIHHAKYFTMVCYNIRVTSVAVFIC